MVPQTVVFLVCLLSITGAFLYPPDCPAHCNCEVPMVKCDGGAIPSLDKRLTSLEIQGTSPPITTLTTTITKKLDQLVSLQLNSIGLTEVQPGALGVIEHLETLKINNNNITTLTLGTFTNCSMLVYLSLENNNIHVIESGAFTSLYGLHNLSLAHNEIYSLPKYLPAKIQALDVAYNKITEVQDLVFKSLISLNLCHNYITHLDPDQTDLKNLKELCLGGPGFILSDKLINQNKFPVLGSLQLTGNSESPLMIDMMSQRNIQNMTTQSLHTLELNSCRLMTLQLFNQANSKLQNLKATDITLLMTRFGFSKFELPSIAIFDLSYSPFLAQLFLTSASPYSMPELKVLKMSHCNIKVLHESFVQYKTPNLSQLDLSNNPLDCTCYGISWIPNYVRQGKLNLLHEESTTCATPSHLKSIPLLTASLCPITIPIPTIMTAKPNGDMINRATTPIFLKNTANSATSPTTEISLSYTITGQTLSTSTKASGKLTSVQPSNPSYSLNVTIPNIDKSQDGSASHMWVIITGAVTGTIILTVLILIVLGILLRCYRSRLLSIQRKSKEAENQEQMVIIRKSRDQLKHQTNKKSKQAQTSTNV